MKDEDGSMNDEPERAHSLSGAENGTQAEYG